MDSRRDFLKKAALLSGATGLAGMLPASIQKAFAINPAEGSTFFDAEHVVILMQENRSFDHAYGMLQGVRGFNDPRAITIPGNNPVWLQTNAAGETYAPFHLDIKNTKITWMGSLPHSWANQVDAFNKGKHDKWLDEKKSGEEEYSHMPLTMGYYTREDIPFYYALADAFTVCDQSFCSSLTGTTPNRLHLWTGTIREEQNENSVAHTYNEEADYDVWVHWKTYPERLEENGVSWKIYQNDISVDGGLPGEVDDWLSNFGDNPIEYFAQYNVKLSKRYINYIQKSLASLPGEIDELTQGASTATGKDLSDLNQQIAEKKATLKKLTAEKDIYTQEKYDSLTQYQKNLHEKAFSSNKDDPHYHDLTPLKYMDGDIEREVNVPKGDVLHQFRQDVNNGGLPTVSWLVAPETFSDHPSSAWYGAWYVSEVLDILTKNPEVWKKTIFILNYDENDGIFDHVPPFTAPNPRDPSTGKTSQGLDTSVDFVTMEQEKLKTHLAEKYRRESSIGLGFRTPLVIASPWSRGGWVCSEVFDHTSPLQFLELFLEKKTGKLIKETNISDWRRAVCGDFTSVFRQYNGDKIQQPQFLNRDEVVEGIHKAMFKQPPSDFKLLSTQDIAQARQSLTGYIPQQEPGIRQSCALPYELYVDGRLTADKSSFEILFKNNNSLHGAKTAGSPFNVYVPVKYMINGNYDEVNYKAYAVTAGSTLNDSWDIGNFENNIYHLRVYGPNGFYRAFKGTKADPSIDVAATYAKDGSNVALHIANNSTQPCDLVINDNSYQTGAQTKTINSGSQVVVTVSTAKSHGWYDATVNIKGNDTFERRYAGRIETGMPSYTDPLMGKV